MFCGEPSFSSHKHQATEWLRRLKLLISLWYTAGVMAPPENAKHLGGHLLKLYSLRVSDFKFSLLRPSNGTLLVKVLQVWVM